MGQEPTNETPDDRPTPSASDEDLVSGPTATVWLDEASNNDVRPDRRTGSIGDEHQDRWKRALVLVGVLLLALIAAAQLFEMSSTVEESATDPSPRTPAAAESLTEPKANPPEPTASSPGTPAGADAAIEPETEAAEPGPTASPAPAQATSPAFDSHSIDASIAVDFPDPASGSEVARTAGFPASRLLDAIEAGRAVAFPTNTGATLQNGSESRQLLMERRPDTLLAYRFGGGVALVSLDPFVGVTASVVEPTDVVLGADLHLIRTRSGTLGIDPATLRVTELSDGYMTLQKRTDGSERYVLGNERVPGEQPVATAVGVDGVTFYDAPADHELLAIDGLGLLAIPDVQDSPTLIGRDGDFEPFRSGRVLAGNANAVVEQICPDQSRCDVMVSSLLTQGQWRVPDELVRLGGNWLPSPNGQRLLRIGDDGEVDLHDPASNRTVRVAARGVSPPVWSLDSSVAFWIDDADLPRLRGMFVPDRARFSLDLPALGAPAPTDRTLTVIPAP